ncbi:MAG TPA: beta-ketoacyl-ACP synthase I, partial [Succinivibrionaceae bacterium]|nr:beta-ketoacyl-ACP synthase I [Succinivibrionaceae bacterium]
MQFHKVVITGLGIVSSIGVGRDAVKDSLENGRSGIKFNASYAEHGMRSQVAGLVPEIDFSSRIDRKMLRFMGEAAAYSHIAMQEAIET